MDLQFDQRDGSMIRTLGDVSVGNPLSEKRSRGETPSFRDVINDIRTDKNNKYRKPIAILAKFGQTQLAVYMHLLLMDFSSALGSSCFLDSTFGSCTARIRQKYYYH